MRILLATDAWEPQVNGVVRTYQRVREELEEAGHEIHCITPQLYKTLPCPTYPEIRLAMVTAGRIRKHMQGLQPDVVHIATEGPIGWATRRSCLTTDIPFTTAYHTRFPEYIHARCRFPLSWSYAHLRKFHNTGKRIMVATQKKSVSISK